MIGARSGRLTALVLGAAVLLGACGDDTKKAAPTTTSTTLSQTELDRRKAEQAVLTAADVPGFTADASPDEGDDSDDNAIAPCFDNNPLIVRLGEASDTRGASSPEFGKGDELIVSSDITFADSDDEAKAAMASVTQPAFATCFSRVTREAMTGEGFTNVTASTTKLPAVTAGDESVGWRTVVRGRISGVAVTMNFDFTFFRVGRAVAVVTTVGLDATFPAAERTRLIGLVATRLAG